MRHPTALILLATLSLLGAAKESPTALKGYQERLKAIDRKSAADWIGVADFCEAEGLLEKRREALRKAVAIEPDHAEARARLDEKRWKGKWIPADQTDDAEAKESAGKMFYGSAWQAEPEMVAAREADRAETGWPHVLRIDTPHLRVFSDAPWPLTRRIADLLENEVGTYRRFHPPAFCPEERLKALESAPLRVFLLGTPRSFAEVASKVRKVGPDLGGFYAEGSRTLYLGRTGNDAKGTFLEVTAAHEMLHALDHVLSGLTDQSLPGWLIEGRACHFGWAVRGRHVMPGTIRFAEIEAYPEKLESCVAGFKLAGLIEMPRGRFRQEEYALGWALVHFLYHGDEGRHAEAFRNYLLKATEKGNPEPGSLPQFTEILGDPSGMEAAYRTYVMKTLAPEGKASRAAKARR